MATNIEDNFIEVEIASSDDFLKVKETLTRMGVASSKEKVLYQSCHILHKKGKYYLVHFKEMFLLDGKPVDLTDEDMARRNVIAKMLEAWELVTISKRSLETMKNVDEQQIRLKIIPFAEKKSWKLVPKYRIGKIKYDK